jgi:hypothetical protein
MPISIVVAASTQALEADHARWALFTSHDPYLVRDT